MKSPIPWVGGKRSLLHEILPRFPLKYSKYIEVFGGGASVLFAKPPTPYEIYNDYNSDLVNLFLVLKEKPISFLKELRLLPINSREEFQYLKKLLKGTAIQYEQIEEEIRVAETVFNEEDYKEIKEILKTKATLFDVNRAVVFYRIQKISYGARGTSYNATPAALSIKKITIEIMRAYHRLQRVVIENQSFEDLIDKHTDDPDAFYYCDPPYYETEGHYDAQFSKEQHEILRDKLTQIRGKFLLSYNDCEYIRELYKDFYIVPVVRLNNLKQKYDPGSLYEELLIANYNIIDTRYTKPKQLNIWEEYE